MTAEQWGRIKAIFEELVERPPEEWPRRLDELVPHDPTLRGEVRRLLALHAQTSAFLDSIPSAAKALRAHTQSAPIFAPSDRAAGRFRIVRLIGAGGMGEVYEAWDETAKTSVALKTIRSGLASHSRIEARFRREVELARQVTHSNVCRVNDIFQHESAGHTVLLLSMELLDGETLAERIEKGGAAPPEEARAIVAQIAAALDAAHGVGVIHRDLKSSNVMLVRTPTTQLRVVVTDFGLAQPLARGATEGGGDRLHAGTPAYMSPEQGRGRPSTPASDIYSLGVLMYEMLTGRLPFPAAEPSRAGRRPPAPPSAIVNGLDPRWDDAIARCLEEDPQRRFASAGAVAAAISPSPSDFGGRRRMLSLLAGLGGSALAGALLLRPLPGGGPSTARSGSSLAVLPFASVPADGSLETVATGLTDDLINRLCQVPGLRVAAPASSFRYGRDPDPAAVRTKLGVSTMVQGSVRESDGRIYLTVRLIDLERNAVVWGDTFERDRAELVGLAPLVARSVTQALGVSLSPAQASMLASRQTRNAEAYDWYLLGRRSSMSRSEAGLLKSIECFDKALAADPGYALALSEKAISLITLAGLPGHPPERPLREAQAIAGEALRLMPDLAEAHLSLGAVYQRLYWNWAEALREFRTARSSQPGLAVARLRLGGLLSNLGRHEEAWHELTTARELDPLSAPVHTALGAALMRGGRRSEAIRQLELTVQIDADYQNAYYLLAQAYALDGRHAEAVETAGQLLKRQPASALNRSLMAYVLGAAGRPTEAAGLLAALETQWTDQYFPPYALAQAYTGSSNRQKVLDWLEKAWRTQDPSLAILKVDPLMNVVHDRAEYRELLRRLKL